LLLEVTPDVRFDPIATELMRRNELPLCAKSRRMHRSKTTCGIPSLWR